MLCEREAIVPTHDFAPAPASPALRAGRAAMRVLLEAAIEMAIDCLDTLDGDPDLEDGADDEPSLGAIEAKIPILALGRLVSAYQGYAFADKAPEPSASNPTYEPVARIGGVDQSRWGFSDGSDREKADDADDTECE